MKAAGLLGSAKIRQEGYEGTKHQSWLQLEMSQRNYFDIHRHWAVGVESSALLSTRGLLGAYDAAIGSAPSYNPTPASNNAFNPALRANSYIAAAFVPVYKYNSSLSARLSANVFVPLRRICPGLDGAAAYGRWFGSATFYGEFNIVYSLPFGDIAGYCNYCSSPGRFNAGISFGIYLPAPKFL